MIQRRKFLSLSALATAAVILPTHLAAIDFRETKASVWTANTIDDAVTNMYGSTEALEKGVTIIAPKVATNSASVPINITSTIDAVSMSVFQDANPESAVAAFTIHANSVIDYNLNIKLKSNGDPITLTAIVQGRDGKLYSAKKVLTVAIGTCDG